MTDTAWHRWYREDIVLEAYHEALHETYKNNREWTIGEFQQSLKDKVQVLYKQSEVPNA